MMSNLMSEFREKIAVQFAYIGCRNVWAIRSIDVVCYAAPAGVSHVCLTILFGYAQDVEIGRKRMPESVGRHLIFNAEFFAEATSATINNPGSLELIKKYFPNAYAKYEKLVEKVIADE